jgi:hypothetical protein
MRIIETECGQTMALNLSEVSIGEILVAVAAAAAAAA